MVLALVARRRQERELVGIRHIVAGNGWTDPELILWVADTLAQDTQLAINSSGVAFAAWSQEDDPEDFFIQD